MIKNFQLTCLACDVVFGVELKDEMCEINYCLNCGEPIDLDNGYEDDSIIEDLDDEFFPEGYAD